MSPVHGQRARFPGYSLELSGRGEVLVYRTALRRIEAALTWSDGAAVLDAESLTVAGGLLRYGVRPFERDFVVRRMTEFLRDGGRTPVSVESPVGLEADGAVMRVPDGGGMSAPAGRVVGAGCAGALLGALLGGLGFAWIALSAGGQVPVPLPRELHNPGQILLFAFIFSVGAVPGAVGGAAAGAFLAWASPARGARPGPPPPPPPA